MRPVTRRALLGLAVVGSAGAAAVLAAASADIPRPRAGGSALVEPVPPAAVRPTRWTVHAPPGPRTVRAENRYVGSRAWATGPKPAGDVAGPVQAYANATSVDAGATIAFHVSATEPYTVDIWRAGYYGGRGARHMATSEALTGTVGGPAAVDPATAGVTADWPVGARLPVPAHFTSGMYYATFTTAAGDRHMVPFVVRDDARRADLCVVLPFTTYQAYNLWPADGRTGTSLYLGYGPDGVANGQDFASAVSFDRPYSGDGVPHHFELDQYFIAWAERRGYDLTYATSLDLHAGRIDPARYRGIVFSGHDEYWSDAMRGALDGAIAAGTGVAFLGANNVYWRIRVAPTAAGGPHRQVECYKRDGTDPYASTGLWRDFPGRAEQGTVGTQFVGIVGDDAPLVVRDPGHWLWQGTGVRDGDEIRDLVGIEADGLTRDAPTVTGGHWRLVSESPYTTRYGSTAVQRTSVWETPHGGLVFNAGTLRWTRALAAPGRTDPRIQRATANVLARITAQS